MLENGNALASSSASKKTTSAKALRTIKIARMTQTKMRSSAIRGSRKVAVVPAKTNALGE